MAVDRITTLRDVGIFRDFHWPEDLPDFGQYNLIYGWNASGKTTISRLFRSLENKTPPASGQMTIVVDGRNISSDEVAQLAIPVRVFNQDFVMESVFPVSGIDIPHIFVIGKDNVEKQKEANRLKDEVARARVDWDSAQSIKEQAERGFDRFCIDRARVIKDILRSSGTNVYNNYDKSNFLDRAQSMVINRAAVTCRLSDMDCEKLLVQQRATPKPKLLLLTYQCLPLQSLRDSVSQLLSTTVVSTTIQMLKDDPTLALWVRQGLSFHNQRHATKCLFCENALSKERMLELEGHFNIEYEKFLDNLEGKIAEIRLAIKTTAELELPNRAQFYDDLTSEYDAAEHALLESLSKINQFFELLEQALTEKKGRVFQPLSLSAAVPEVDSRVVDRLNDVIKKHNQACDDFESRIVTSRERLESNAVATDLEEFVRLRDAITAAEAAATISASKYEQLIVKVAALEREIVEHRRPAEELNSDLHKYLGHDELRLDIKDTGYMITRNGTPADALSEGESTAIALLYFLKSLEDRRFDLENGIVVFDDPVSSLDANALFLAFGFIRKRTENVGQLFVLTHNFTFFRQVRNWFHFLKGQNKPDVNQRPARFYMLNCVHGQGERCSEIQPLDPLLERFNSEYHYLFARVYKAATMSTLCLEESYMFPNMARRLLEAFLAFRQPQVSGELWQKLKAINYDEAKKMRIVRFLHTHSHGDAIEEPEHDLSLLSETGAVLKDLLDLIKDQDLKHFEAMVTLINPPTGEGVGR